MKLSKIVEILIIKSNRIGFKYCINKIGNGNGSYNCFSKKIHNKFLFCTKNQFEIEKVNDNTNISEIKEPKLINLNRNIDNKDKIPNKIEKLSRKDLLLNPELPNYLEDLKKYSREIQHIEFRKYLAIIEKEREERTNYILRLSIAAFLFFVGLYFLWVPMYRVVCEHAGFLVKTAPAKYKDYKGKINLNRKFKINFHHETDEDLPWEFTAQQDSVYITAGETCLVFYKARNKTADPIVGLSVYDVHPQVCAYYFNKVQCFCFENQMLGPYEEVDLPVLFYIDPAIQEDKYVIDHGYFDINLKYTFYFARKQDLAVIMKKRLKEEKENDEKLKEIKKDLNKQYGYEKYLIEDISENTLPGINPLLKDFKLENI